MSSDIAAVSPFAPGPPTAWLHGRWICHPQARTSPMGVDHFRRTITLQAIPQSLRVRVTADNRYELFVNGQRVSMGPARGDIQHWRYETVDLAPYLKPGKNVIAAITWFLNGFLSPWAQMGHSPGFFVSGDAGDDAALALSTPAEWVCYRNPAYDFLAVDKMDVPDFSAVGPGDYVEGDKYPWGWQLPEYDDSAWIAPVVGAPGAPRGACDAPGYRWLTPNLLPPQQQESQPVTDIVRAEGMDLPVDGLTPTSTITVGPGEKVKLLFDYHRLTTGYPELTLEGGNGATVRVKYAEGLWGGPELRRKYNRDEVADKVMRGHTDTYLPDGQRRTFRPLWWRTFRYLQVEVEAGAEALELCGITNQFTAYPFEEVAAFASDDASLKRIWDVSWWTARLCAHETYMDCPYYEQLQYGGDTRIQCLVSYYMSGDPRLARNAIAQLDDSRLPDGITQSRYPSQQTQVIPPFALWWVGMIHDYWMYVGDPDFVSTVLPGARATLEWYIKRLQSNGLLGPQPWWNFVDWAPEFSNGVCPGANEGNSSIISLQLVLALREAAELEDAFGFAGMAQRYRDIADNTAAAVRDTCWNSQRGLLGYTPTDGAISQHANILAILADLFEPEVERQVAQRILTEPADSMAQATFYFRFYLHRAARKAGFGGLYLEWLKPWYDMLDIGLTTWAENPEPSRSDCHAWSAHPNVDLLATVLGVESAAPGFSQVRITPHLGGLNWAEGVVPHPRGKISVKLARNGDQIDAQIELPGGVSGELRHAGSTIPLRPGAQSVTI